MSSDGAPRLEGPTGRKNGFAQSLQPGANVVMAAIASNLLMCKSLQT